MALQIWLPLNTDLRNQGLSDLKFSVVDSNLNKVNEGKFGNGYKNNSYAAGGLVSDKKITLGTKQSVFCWAKITALTSSASLGGGLAGQHRYPINAGMGITILYISSTTGYLSVNTGNGSSRTFNTYCGSTLLTAGKWYHLGYTYDGTTIKLYVNGVLDGTHTVTSMSCPNDYFHVFAWSLGSSDTSNKTLYSGYHFNGIINDVRAYDNCLPATDVAEIARGLVVEAAGIMGMIDSSKNIIAHPTIRTGDIPTTIGWDASKHPGAIYVNGWSSGYNGGVPSPSTGYHAYWRLMDSIPTMVFQNKNNEVGQGMRWLGISYGILYGALPTNCTYTVSFDAKCDTSGMFISTGLYHRKVGSTSYAFHEGRKNIYPKSSWQRYELTWTSNNIDINQSASFYFYGHNGAYGTSYVRNVQLEIAPMASEFASSKNSLVPNAAGIAPSITINGNVSKTTGEDGLTMGGGTLRHANAVVNGTAQSWTCMAWIYSTSMNGKLNNFNLGNHLKYGTCPLLYLNSGTNDYYNYGNMAIPSNEWVHVAFAFDNATSTKRIYINGVDKTNTGGPNKTSTPGGISTEVIVGESFNGEIKDYKEFVTCLSATDIKAIYDKSVTTPPNDEIWYTSTDGNIVTPYDTSVFGANIVSNTYENGRGIIKFDGDVTSIGENAFYNCTRLTSFALPNSVTKLFEYAFGSCTGLTSIVIPNSVQYIYDEAFDICTNLTSVVLGNGIQYLGWGIFYGVTKLTEVIYKGTTSQWNNINKEDGYWAAEDFTIKVVRCTNGNVDVPVVD